MPAEGAAFLADESAAEQLRGVFAEHGYDERRVRERLGGTDINRLSQKSLPRFLALTSEGAPLDILIRLFVLRVCVSEAEAVRALSPIDLVSWIGNGVLVFRDECIQSLIRIRPFAGRLLAFDPSDSTFRFDHVLGPGRASIELHNATMRIPFGRALDLGTGCGVQGLGCALHCGQVVCTDVNPRALALAKFNSRLNGAANIEFRSGSLFEPVGSEIFNLILMNMPYAISPDVRFLFRDAGDGGDEFLQRLIREAPAHLAPGGFCLMTAQWAQTDDEPWRARLWKWFRELPFDVWILRQSTQTAASYAENWIAETERPGDAKRWQDWMEYLHRLHIEAIHTGIICLRRRERGAGWFSITDDIATIPPGSGDDLLAGFGLRDFLSALRNDVELLNHSYRVSPKTRISQTSEPAERGWRTTKIILRNHGGLPFACKIDGHVLALILKLNGTQTLDEVIDQFASDAQIDWAPLTEHVVSMARSLIEQGFLLPAT